MNEPSQPVNTDTQKDCTMQKTSGVRWPICQHYIPSKKRNCKKRVLPNCHFCAGHINEQTPMHIIDKPSECPVCMEEFDEKAKPLLCGHWVHRSCVVQSGKTQCPVCRQHVYMSASERRACTAYKHRYMFARPPTASTAPSTPSEIAADRLAEYGLIATALGAQIDAILHTYPTDVQTFINTVGLDNIIDPHLYTLNPLLFQNALVSYLNANTLV